MLCLVSFKYKRELKHSTTAFAAQVFFQIVTMDRFIKVTKSKELVSSFFCIHAHFLFQLIIKSGVQHL